jgi:aspartate aminotransferase-like enzyme
VDKFHSENKYVICLAGRQLAGMICVRGKRPFSLDHRIPRLDDYLPAERRVCEIRLLAVDKSFRHSAVLPGLLAAMARFGQKDGYNFAVISGTTRQLKLYRHIGFVPFGPLVGGSGAQFQPMMLSLESFIDHAGPLLQVWKEKDKPPRQVNFLPGPVEVHSSVRRALASPPVSHRSARFLERFHQLQENLCELAGATRVEVMLGSGTLANDAVAAQISLLTQPGLVLSNGEFGERLTDHARRFGVRFETLKNEWGVPFSVDAIQKRLDEIPGAGWIWGVHCETSTGMLNEIDALKQLCTDRDLKLCLDCISSIGNLPVDLGQVHLASGVSGKGLAGYPGLALVFYNHQLLSASGHLPRYLDLGFYNANQGTPFTHSSNLLAALAVAIERARARNPFERKRSRSSWLRQQLRERGFEIVAPEAFAAPAVVTVVLPPSQPVAQVGSELEEFGFHLSYRSEYLRQRNWIQICLMGECRQADLARLLDKLTEICDPPSRRDNKPEAAPASDPPEAVVLTAAN